MKPNHIIVTVVVAIIVGAASFYGGMQYQKTQRGSFASRIGSTTGTNGTSRTGTTMQGRRPISGEIVSVDKDTLTIKTSDGGSKVVVYSTDTTVTKQSEATISDLAAGTKVTVIGTESSGTVTAQSISIGTGMMFGGPGNGLKPPEGQISPPADGSSP